jgi:hypothetical protein
MCRNVSSETSPFFNLLNGESVFTLKKPKSQVLWPVVMQTVFRC